MKAAFLFYVQYCWVFVLHEGLTDLICGISTVLTQFESTNFKFISRQDWKGSYSTGQTKILKKGIERSINVNYITDLNSLAI